MFHTTCTEHDWAVPYYSAQGTLWKNCVHYVHAAAVSLMLSIPACRKNHPLHPVVIFAVSVCQQLSLVWSWLQIFV